MVIKTDDGVYLYVYKTTTGECWFEYTPARNQKKMRQKLSFLANSLLIEDDEEAQPACKMVTILDEEKFISVHMDQIVTPSTEV